MDQQQRAAMEAMAEWLSHPGELGKAPAKIEPAGEFDLHDLHYYIFKYKKGLLGKWLLGVCGGYEPGEMEHCGHVYSEMEVYDPKTAEEKAAAMVELVRQYWMDRAKEAEEGGQEENGDTGSFVGFVLLSAPSWDPEQYRADLKADWGVDCGCDGSEKDPLVWDVGGMMAAVSLMESPVPGGEAEANAANNYMWPEAVEAARSHRAHLVVAVLGKEAPLKERGLLLVKIIAACCKQKAVLGVYTSGTVFQPQFYIEGAEMMKDGGLPVLNWIYFGLYKSEGGWNSYTYGMKNFGKDEMEVLDARDDPQNVRGFLLDMAYYVLSENVTLLDGETIGFDASQRLPIMRGKGVSLDGDTLKIGYPAG